MIPKIIAKGKSFKGAAAYLLHDKAHALSSDRVAWVETRNLVSDDPQLGWRIMAATALDQERLKQMAGVKSTGRRSDKAVLHLSLSWHPDEQETLSREEMRRAAIGALKAIGADDRQAIFIAHNDESHPHLHILCNRVSPDDGRMLSSSKDRLHLSKWAEKYEKERGRIYCEDRIVNNERRREGEYVRGAKNQPRHIFEAVNDNSRGKSLLFSAERKRDYALAEGGRAMASAHQAAWKALVRDHKKRQANLRAETQKALKLENRRIGDAYHPKRRALNEKHRLALQSFETQEKRLLGRLKNTYESLNLRAYLRGDKNGRAIGDVFKLISSRGARRTALLNAQRREKTALNRSQAREFAKCRRALLSSSAQKMEETRISFLENRYKLARAQEREQHALKEAWSIRSFERKRAFELVKAAAAEKGHARADFEKSARPAKSAKSGGSKQSEAPAHQEPVQKKAQKIKARLKGRTRDERER